MAFLHSLPFVILLFTFPIWGGLIAFILGKQGTNSLSPAKSLSRVLWVYSLQALIFIIFVAFKGEQRASAEWSSFFVSLDAIHLWFSAFAGPWIVNFLVYKTGDGVDSFTGFFVGSLFASIMVWGSLFILYGLLCGIFGGIQSLINIARSVTAQ